MRAKAQVVEREPRVRVQRANTRSAFRPKSNLPSRSAHSAQSQRQWSPMVIARRRSRMFAGAREERRTFLRNVSQGDSRGRHVCQRRVPDHARTATIGRAAATHTTTRRAARDGHSRIIVTHCIWPRRSGLWRRQAQARTATSAYRADECRREPEDAEETRILFLPGVSWIGRRLIKTTATKRERERSQRDD